MSDALEDSRRRVKRRVESGILLQLRLLAEEFIWKRSFIENNYYFFFFFFER